MSPKFSGAVMVAIYIRSREIATGKRERRLLDFSGDGSAFHHGCTQLRCVMPRRDCGLFLVRQARVSKFFKRSLTSDSLVCLLDSALVDCQKHVPVFRARE